MAVALATPSLDDLAADDLEFWSVAKFCIRFDLSRSFTYDDLIATGKLSTVKIGRTRRIPITAVRKFAASLTGGDLPASQD